MSLKMNAITPTFRFYMRSTCINLDAIMAMFQQEKWIYHRYFKFLIKKLEWIEGSRCITNRIRAYRGTVGYNVVPSEEVLPEENRSQDRWRYIREVLRSMCDEFYWSRSTFMANCCRLERVVCICILYTARSTLIRTTWRNMYR